MTSRIPRPQISQENYNECSGEIQGKKVAGGVKRKALEPVSDNIVVNSKKERGRPDGETEPKAVVVSQSQQMVDVSIVPPEELELWERAKESMGWDEVGCLTHKLTLPKRGDASKKVEVLGQHVKRLRSVGWYLYAMRASEIERHVEDVQNLEVEKDTIQKKCTEAEKKVAEAEEREKHLAMQMLEVNTDMEESRKEVVRLEEKIESIESSLISTKEAKEKLEERVASLTESADALKHKVCALETAQQEGQKYTMNLQEYNTKLQSDLLAANETMEELRKEKAALTEEKAGLAGRVQTLGDALEALQAASSDAEAARKNALEDIGRLRGEVAAYSMEKESLAKELSTLKEVSQKQRSDLERYLEITGKDLEALEAEKANSSALSKRTKAQAEALAALQDQVTLLKEQRNASEAQFDASQAENRSLKARIAELEVLLPDLEQRLRESEAVRRKLHNTVLELKGNVRVFCRVRPLMKNENTSAVDPLTSGEYSGRGLELLHHTSKGKQPSKHVFTFDRVFGPQSSQEEVFDEVSMLVQSALDGYRVCIFAYGQTGSGKTHTMLGTPTAEGIIPRGVRQVFETSDRASEQGWKYTMKAAMLEIYNEELKDLLGSGPPAGKKHVISHADTGKASGVEVSHLKWVDVSSSQDVASLLDKAMSQRSVAATACNEHSSRSHMVFVLAVEGTNEASGQTLSGALNLVDLAGSERLDKSEVTGDRLKETQAINKSLSALGDVIAALGSKESYVPYRNSKLTFLLQNSLSGSGKALMLCNVGPSAAATNETLCTLRFASKVNATNIGTARRNIQ